MPQNTTQILIGEMLNLDNDYEAAGCWFALGLRSEYHGQSIDWQAVFQAINARWGLEGTEEVKRQAHQRFVEAWEHDFNNFLASIGGGNNAAN